MGGNGKGNGRGTYGEVRGGIGAAGLAEGEEDGGAGCELCGAAPAEGGAVEGEVEEGLRAGRDAGVGEADGEGADGLVEGDLREIQNEELGKSGRRADLVAVVCGFFSLAGEEPAGGAAEGLEGGGGGVGEGGVVAGGGVVGEVDVGGEDALGGVCEGAAAGADV